MPFTVSVSVLFKFPPNSCFVSINPEPRLPDLVPEWKSLTDTHSRPGSSKAVTSFTRTPVYVLRAVTNALQGHWVLLSLHLLLREISV